MVSCRCCPENFTCPLVKSAHEHNCIKGICRPLTSDLLVFVSSIEFIAYFCAETLIHLLEMRMRELDVLIDQSITQNQFSALVREMDVLDEARLLLQKRLLRNYAKFIHRDLPLSHVQCHQSPLENPPSTLQCPGASRRKRLKGMYD